MPHEIVDHRIYTIRLRKMDEFIEVWDRLAMPILLRTLGSPLGFWTSLVGPQNQFIHCWGYESLADYDPSRGWLHLGVPLHPGAERYYREKGWLHVSVPARGDRP